MGIVICVTILLTLSVLRPSPWNGRREDASPIGFYSFVSIISALFGAWNAFYGLLNLFEFWGITALISGVLLLCASLTLVLERSRGISIAYWPRLMLVLGLAFSFLLYAITIIQLNLGLPYLGQS